MHVSELHTLSSSSTKKSSQADNGRVRISKSIYIHRRIHPRQLVPPGSARRNIKIVVINVVSATFVHV